MVVRSATHKAGATALTKLLECPTPATDQRTVPCSCGYPAHYRELRSKPVLTVVGKVEVPRPYYLCRTAMLAHSPPRSNWTSTKRSSLLGCAACRRSWARRRPSTTGVSR
jgi:hypothetical protein